MIYTPPDYRALYEEQNILINRLHNEKMVLYESLRDRFAMAAMTGVIAPTQGTWNANRVAKSCYQLADAMLKEREDHSAGECISESDSRKGFK